MAWAWIELDDDQAGWGPTRVLITRLGRDGYAADELIGSGPKVLIITGGELAPSDRAAMGGHREPRSSAAPRARRLRADGCPARTGRRWQLPRAVS